MNNVKSVSWVRMVLAFGAVLLVAGSGLALASGPNPAYSPTASIILGPSLVGVSSSTQYTFEVTFSDGSKFDFPSSSVPAGSTLTFTAVNGTVSSSGLFTAPGAPGRAKVAASFTQNNVTTSASKFIFVQ